MLHFGRVISPPKGQTEKNASAVESDRTVGTCQGQVIIRRIGSNLQQDDHGNLRGDATFPPQEIRRY